MNRRVMSWVGAVLLCWAAPVFGQEVVVTGPPPELRKNLDAFLKALNSSSVEDYEAMAKATFAPAFYKQQTADQRRQHVTQLRKEFGQVTFERVQRDGPDEPLVITVKGTVASGTFRLELDDTHRIAGVRAQAAKSPDRRS